VTPPPGSARPSLAAVLNAAPDLATAAAFVVTWVAPTTFGERALSRFMLVMLLEFFVVHSSAFIGAVALSDLPRAKRAVAVLGLSSLYLLFVVVLGFAFHDWWPVAAFGLLTLNRLLGVLLGQAAGDEQKAFVMRGWAASVAFYVGGCFLTIFLPLPALGVTRAVVEAQHFSASGLWIDEPQRVLAFGVVYFCLMGWSELRSHAWITGVRARQGRRTSRGPGGNR
jgi:hypothetical protein